MAKQNEPLFRFENIHVTVEEKEVVKGVSLTINAGEKHAIMGPNGSGKSSLANALMGHPNYEITKGSVYIRGEDVTNLDPNERAEKGLFLGMQYPVAIPGVTVANFLRTAVKMLPDGLNRVKTLRKDLKASFKELGIDQSFATRYVNDGFSGGEKKRLEILQLAILKPHVAMLDETDSGLDIDALQIVAAGINSFCGEDAAVMLITHYQRMLNYIKVDKIHVLMDGKIAISGGPELALELEEKGYDWLDNGKLESVKTGEIAQ
ncbi:Fe-S cluster assembly ATPase SufC [candidate division KSB1 bacterium]|nr:Fe-S cluster assembly ATPase SufC [candidate division KSB1 bacterium]